MHSFPRPHEHHLTAERTAAQGACPQCGSAALADYRVLSEGGWFEVRKCQSCLASISRVPAPPFGSYRPLGLEIARHVTGAEG